MYSGPTRAGFSEFGSDFAVLYGIHRALSPNN